jgi:hypothetical protein
MATKGDSSGITAGDRERMPSTMVPQVQLVLPVAAISPSGRTVARRALLERRPQPIQRWP